MHVFKAVQIALLSLLAVSCLHYRCWESFKGQKKSQSNQSQIFLWLAKGGKMITRMWGVLVLACTCAPVCERELSPASIFLLYIRKYNEKYSRTNPSNYFTCILSTCLCRFIKTRRVYTWNVRLHGCGEDVLLLTVGLAFLIWTRLYKSQKHDLQITFQIGDWHFSLISKLQY